MNCINIVMNSQRLSDKVALSITLFLRWFADTFFAKRYGHRAVVLETVAGVPGMVGGMWLHLKSLRLMRDEPWIHTLLEEAENERMHLMIFINIAKPNLIERLLILIAQFIFWHCYFVLYTLFPRTAHKMVEYFEEQAVISYTEYLNLIEQGEIENVPAPQIAIDYYDLPQTAKLSDVIVCIRNDENRHRVTNQGFALSLSNSKL